MLRGNPYRQLQPFMASAVDYLAQWCAYLGLDAQIVSAYRSPAEQDRLYAIGRTPLEVQRRVKKQGRDGAVTDAAAGESAHNYGLAIDVEGRDQAKVVEVARQLGFGTVSWDPAHIEWPNWRSLLN